MRAPGARPRRRHAPGRPPPPAHPCHGPPPLLLLLALLMLLQGVSGSGFFELQILEFSNYHETLASRACCGGGRPPPCAAPCRPRFDLCLKEYQSAVTAGGCSFGRASSPALGAGSFTLPEPAAAAHPLTLPFTFRWTRSFTLILQAYDDYNYTDPEETGLIEEASWSGIVEPSAAWHTLRHAGSTAAVTYRVRVVCQPNYYNATCTTFCRPRDDKFGHYTCSTTGDKRCLPGWHGDNCEIPVCKSGCHPTHGRCDRPGDCDCRPGWRGEFCSQCQPYPGCKHGYCNGSSWDCTCDTNWGGILCDQDLNYCGTHEPCQHGGTCENTAPDQYLCTCAEGFSGTDCERVDNPCAPQPCAHGTCHLAPAPAPAPAPAVAVASPSSASAAPSALSPAQSGFMCVCERGYTGPLCDIDVDECASSPCLHGATCRDLIDAFACECAPGWTGTLCADDVDECATSETDPCVNAAACTNNVGGYSCSCLAGWTGRRCDVNIDDCAGQCLHGATCIDLVDDFHCACAAGYTGRTCARDVDDCVSRPCRNGGECVDLLDAYRCICPVGFSGTDCELTFCFGRYCQDDRDHCAGSPCGNGAPCYNAQGDYYCHCTPGWAGKNCTQRAPGPPVPPADVCADGSPCARGRCVRAPPAPPHCSCEPGFRGPTCNDKTEECLGEPCRNNGTCIEALGDFACLCRDGWTGKTCTERVGSGPCREGACRNGGTCLEEGGGWRCACPPGFGGAACQTSSALAGGGCQCAHGGTCAPAATGWTCACREGYTGARCEREVDGCASGPCRNGGRCVGGAGWFTCSCTAGWGGAECRTALADCTAPAPAPCPPHAACRDTALGYRCLCPPPRAPHTRRCLELSVEMGRGETEGEGPGECAAAANATWWWGCNVCWCGEAGDAPACTRLWCGLPDCLAPATAAQCRADEVCVPAGSALCLRAPCAPLGECRRVAGRRVEPPPLPAPTWCWPTGGVAGAAGVAGPAGGTRGSAWCARLALELARERLARGAHVERACSALRRALAAALAPGGARAVLVLLCDLAPDDDDLLELALWSPEEEGAESAALVAEGVRALSELVSRRRLAHHPLLAAALRLRTHTPPIPPAGPAPAASAQHPGAGVLVVAAVVPLLVCAAGVAAALWLRRRRAAAAAERSRRCDEEKSNNLQNEENLRRYANPLRDEPKPGGAGAGAGGGGSALPQAHSLYKAQNADARNNTAPPPGPRLHDKECTKRALPPHPAVAVLAPPERLTVLV